MLAEHRTAALDAQHVTRLAALRSDADAVATRLHLGAARGMDARRVVDVLDDAIDAGVRSPVVMLRAVRKLALEMAPIAVADAASSMRRYGLTVAAANVDAQLRMLHLFALHGDAPRVHATAGELLASPVLLTDRAFQQLVFAYLLIGSSERAFKIVDVFGELDGAAGVELLRTVLRSIVKFTRYRGAYRTHSAMSRAFRDVLDYLVLSPATRRGHVDSFLEAVVETAQVDALPSVLAQRRIVELASPGHLEAAMLVLVRNEALGSAVLHRPHHLHHRLLTLVEFASGTAPSVAELAVRCSSSSVSLADGALDDGSQPPLSLPQLLGLVADGAADACGRDNTTPMSREPLRFGIASGLHLQNGPSAAQHADFSGTSSLRINEALASLHPFDVPTADVQEKSSNRDDTRSIALRERISLTSDTPITSFPSLPPTAEELLSTPLCASRAVQAAAHATRTPTEALDIALAHAAAAATLHVGPLLGGLDAHGNVFTPWRADASLSAVEADDRHLRFAAGLLLHLEATAADGANDDNGEAHGVPSALTLRSLFAALALHGKALAAAQVAARLVERRVLLLDSLAVDRVLTNLAPLIPAHQLHAVWSAVLSPLLPPELLATYLSWIRRGGSGTRACVVPVADDDAVREADAAAATCGFDSTRCVATLAHVGDGGDERPHPEPLWRLLARPPSDSADGPYGSVGASTFCADAYALHAIRAEHLEGNRASAPTAVPILTDVLPGTHGGASRKRAQLLAAVESARNAVPTARAVAVLEIRRGHDVRENVLERAPYLVPLRHPAHSGEANPDFGELLFQ